MVRRDWTDRLLALLARVVPAGMSRRMEDFVHSFLDGFLFLTRPANFAVIIVLSVAVWGLYVLMVYVAFFAFGHRKPRHVRRRRRPGNLQHRRRDSHPGRDGKLSRTHVAVACRSSSASMPALALSYATVTHAAGYLSTTVIGLYYLLRDQIRTAEAFGDTPVGGS